MGDNSGMHLERGNGDAPAVLVVEDSENSAATLEIALLGIPGVAVLLTTSGVEAMRILESGEAHVQVIVTDLNMPVMDGFELIRRVRADQRLAGLPIVVVSGDTDPATPSRIAAMGVNAFFPKPFSPAQVRRKLEQLLDGSSQ
jgi:CheY-like chemotaxis protein